jgi:G3E family GTPase
MMLVDQATPANLFNTGLFETATKTADVTRWLNAEAVEQAAHDHHDHHHHHGHDHHHHHDHGHDVNRHDARIRAHCLRSNKPLDPRGFDLFLNMLREFHGPSLLRVKGIVALSDDLSRPLVIHGVQHVFHPPVRLEAWPDADHSTRIVFILKDLGVDFVEKLWAAFANITQTDTPDRAAMEDNPLTSSRSGGLFS